jgi:hypothetical protein
MYFHTFRRDVKKLMKYLVINGKQRRKPGKLAVVGPNERHGKGGKHLEYHKFATAVVQRPRWKKEEKNNKLLRKRDFALTTRGMGFAARRTARIGKGWHGRTGISTFLISFHVRYYAPSCREADE